MMFGKDGRQGRQPIEHDKAFSVSSDLNVKIWPGSQTVYTHRVNESPETVDPSRRNKLLSNAPLLTLCTGIRRDKAKWKSK